MTKKMPPDGINSLKDTAKDICRTVFLIAFCVGALFGIIGGMYAYVAHSESQKSFVAYDTDNWPNSFPILIERAQEDGHPAVQIDFCYLTEDGTVEQELYQIPGNGQVQIGEYDSGYYTVEAISASRTQVTLNFWTGGGDGKVRYIYEIENSRVHPQSYQLMAYFGWMFKALPLGFLATGVFIFICKLIYNLISAKMAVRRLEHMN